MLEETLLAFDVGVKRIGVAMGNTLMRDARPLEIIPAGTRDERFARIAALLKEWQPQRIVVGLSLAADGGEQPMTVQCRRFANQIYGRFGLPVVLVDERYSSMIAQSQRKLKRGEGDDALAAAVILQRYFDDPLAIQLPTAMPVAKSQAVQAEVQVNEPAADDQADDVQSSDAPLSDAPTPLPPETSSR